MIRNDLGASAPFSLNVGVKNMKKEIWKDIEGFDGYQISNFGRVRSFRDYHNKIIDNPHELKLLIRKDYYYVDLYTIDKKNYKKSVHRLVAEAFLEPPENTEMVINHIDGNKLNNKSWNLEWVTTKENSHLASINGLYKTRPIEIVETGEKFKSIRDCAEYLKGHPSDISHVLNSTKNTYKGYHFRYVDNTKNILTLKKYQLDAIDKIKNGSILCGKVGSGKSRTALGYYLFKICRGDVRVYNYEELLSDPPGFHSSTKEMKEPVDLYIITTAKKRDSKEWEKECSMYRIFKDPYNSLSGVKLTIDSWNNIKKYKNIHGAFFIFDEQRVVGRGAWVKAFLNITRKNRWILLSGSPGDSYSDYIPVMIANGFFKNRTEFNNNHCVFSPYTKFPKIEKYVGTKKLDKIIEQILVTMEDQRHTIRHNEYIITEYDQNLYRMVMRNRWDPYENCPIEETGKLMYLIRRVVNSDKSRIKTLDKILKDRKCLIVFYNFDYELEMLKMYLDSVECFYSEWNGHKHQDLPKGERWVYLVQYSAGCEGWNCITTDTVVFFSQNYSYRVLEQASGRIDRMNTPFEDLYYYHLRSNAPIDIAIWRKLKNKKDFNERSFMRRNAR